MLQLADKCCVWVPLCGGLIYKPTTERHLHIVLSICLRVHNLVMVT